MSSRQRVSGLARIVVSGFILASSAFAQGLPRQGVPDAYIAQPFEAVMPPPKEAEFPAGTLALDGLGVKLENGAQELQWAGRDLGDELRIRLNRKLEGSGKTIRIGTLENAGLASEAKTRGITPDKKEGYGLWVDANGAGIVGFDALGAYRGAQTLRQLLTPAGFRFAKVRDWPTLSVRAAMIYLDANSKGVNDLLVPLLARMKFSHVLVMCNYVKWNASRAVWHPQGASRDEAQRVAELIRTSGMEAIPLIETPGHAQWMFFNPVTGRFDGQKELWQDPNAQTPYAYDTLNPKTYEFLLPVFSEAVEVFKPKFVHIGHDEARSVNRFPARENGLAVGFEKLFLDDTLKLYAHLKSLGVGTMMWHDVALNDSYREKILPALPKDIVLTNWHYGAADNYPTFKQARDAGFQVVGASWFAGGNPEAIGRAALRDGILGGLQTRWTGYFGNTSIFDGQAEQGVAYLAAANAFWNPEATPAPNLEGSSTSTSRATPVVAGPAPKELLERYRDAYRPGSYRALPGQLVDLSSLVNRKLTDPDETQWIQKGPGIDLSSVPTGVNRYGAYQFNVSGAIMLKGARPAAADLPASITLELGGAKAAAIAFLHTSGWSSQVTSPRTKIGQYVIQYDDGSSATQPLEYGRHLVAWTDLNGRSMIPEPAWRGKTKDDLDVGLFAYTWTNPNPAKPIKSITLSSEGLQSNPALIGLTLLETNP